MKKKKKRKKQKILKPIKLKKKDKSCFTCFYYNNVLCLEFDDKPPDKILLRGCSSYKKNKWLIM